MQAAFLQHEGYLGAIGALMSYGDPIDENLTLEESNEKVSPYAEYIQKYMFFLDN
jgi:type II pantothenate kinase